jgi:hypothetical protein
MKHAEHLGLRFTGIALAPPVSAAGLAREKRPLAIHSFIGEDVLQHHVTNVAVRAQDHGGPAVEIKGRLMISGFHPSVLGDFCDEIEDNLTVGTRAPG